jgi:alkanesulfonate monooxygenase SsuD/methylene tetrahydromethanopterin reductase-like flavin-dependent oxidoreductase (luciferase family)
VTAADPRPARVGVQLQPQHAAYSDIRRACAQAEEIGVDIVFNWDHFYPLSGEPEGSHFECWTMLGAFAEATEKVEIGALVTCNSYRNPQLLADMARTVDHISDGRLILGIGSGWFEKDYDEYGYEFGTAGGRRKTLRIVAEHADIWHGFGSAAAVAHKHGVLDEWCSKVGRDPLQIERSAGVSAKDPASSAESLYTVGTRLFTVGLEGPTYDLGPVRDLVAWRDQRNQT